MCRPNTRNTKFHTYIAPRTQRIRGFDNFGRKAMAIGNEMSNTNTNDQRSTFDASRAFHVSYVSLKWILFLMIPYNFPYLVSHEDITTQAFSVIEFINLSLLQMAKSTDKEAYWVIWFIFQFFELEILLWLAVYPSTSVAVNLCLALYIVVKFQDSQCLWSQLKEVLLPLGDEPFSEVEMPWL